MKRFFVYHKYLWSKTIPYNVFIWNVLILPNATKSSRLKRLNVTLLDNTIKFHFLFLYLQMEKLLSFWFNVTWHYCIVSSKRFFQGFCKIVSTACITVINWNLFCVRLFRSNTNLPMSVIIFLDYLNSNILSWTWENWFGTIM